MASDDIIQAFLKRNHLEMFPLQWLTQDASMRRYARIECSDKSYILMDSPQTEHPYEFYTVDKILLKHGLSAPVIYDEDLQNGLLLLEDFGDNTYAALLKRSSDQEHDLYTAALDVLIKLRSVPLSDIGAIAKYQEPQMIEHLETFTDWFMPYVLHGKTQDSVKADFIRIWKKLIPQALETGQGLILWDFHINNLMKLDRPGVQSCGILDFQDARIGPFSYDLVSLLEDARRPMNTALRTQLMTRYLSEIPVQEQADFIRSYHILAAKRHLRVLGFFVRLCQRDHKAGYLKHLPHVYGLLEQHLEEPYLAELKEWFYQTLPHMLPEEEHD